MGNETASAGDLLNFQPGENYEGFVCSIFAISPALGNCRIEELGEHFIRVRRTFAHLQETSSLELSEALKFATGKTG